MKKILLPLLASAFALTANAQLADGDYLIKNVATGKYLGGANSWSTQASLLDHGAYVFTLKLADGKYTLDSHTYNSDADHFLGDKGYVDSGAFNFTIAKAEGGYTIASGEGKYVAPAADGKTIDCGAAEAAVWQILTMDEAKATLSGASQTNPMDATFIIKAANFSRNLYGREANPWVVEPGCNNKNLCGGNVNSNACAESYHSPFTIHQVITGMPNGIYELTAQGFYRQDDGVTEKVPVFYINEETTTFPLKTGTENSMTDASNSFSEGKYYIDPITVTVTDGTIDVGIKNEEATHIWCIWDNFQLTYLGEASDAALLAGAIAKYEAALQKALDVNLTLPMYGEAKDAVTAKTTTYSKGNTSFYTKPEEYEAATAALEAVTAAALKSIEEYASLEYIIDYYKALDPAGKEVAGYDGVNGNRLYKNFVNKWNKGTLDYGNVNLEGESGIINLLREAVKAQNTVGADYTAMIDNPNFDGNINGWTDTFEGKLYHGYQSNSTYGSINQFMECWAGQWSGAAAPYILPNGKLYQSVDLPAGRFTLTADVIATQQQAGQEGYIASHAEETGIYLFAKSGAIFKSDALSITADAANKEMSFEFSTTGGATEIGLLIEETNCNWTVMDNVRLAYAGPLKESAELMALRSAVDNAVADPDAVMAEQAIINQYKTAKSAAEALYNDTEQKADVYNAAKDALDNATTSLNASIETYKKIDAINQKVAALADQNIEDAYKSYLLAYVDKKATASDLAAYEAFYKKICMVEIEGNVFDISYSGQVVPEDAKKLCSFESGYHQINPSTRDFDPATDKQIVIKLSEPLDVQYNTPYKTEDGDQKWHATNTDAPGYSIIEIDVTEVMKDFCIQHINGDSGHSFTIEESYVVKNDESKVPLSWASDWGSSVSAIGLTSGTATISAQWDGVRMTCPEAFLMNGKKTLRIYTENSLEGLPFQWCATKADGSGDMWPSINVDANNKYYAEYSFDNNIKSFYLQHTSADSHTLNIRAITWEYEAEVPMNIDNSAKYATFCAPAEVAIPADVTAYVVGSVDEHGQLTLKELTGTIPANCPVVLNSEITYTNAIKITSKDLVKGTPNAGLLTGVFTKTKVAEGNYILQKNDGKVGFYKVAEGSDINARAWSAYLTVPASSVKAYYLSEEGAATAIETIDALTSGKAEIYDMSGRKLTKLQKGINIVNGKKVMVK